MKKKKMVLSCVFFILLIALTLYVIFSNYDINTIYNNMLLVKPIYLVGCLLLVCLYFIFQGIYMKYILHALDVETTLKKCTFYSVIEFFFSAITPSSTGGQPVQMYYMSKDKIPMRKSLIVLILNTIIFKLYLIVGGILILIFRPDYIFESRLLIQIFFYLGILIDALVILGCYMLMYHKKIIKQAATIFYKLKKLILKKDYDSNRLDELLSKYVNEAKFINSHVKEIVISVILTFIQRTLMFSILYMLYRSFGFKEYTYLEILLLQIFVQISIEGLILPGGVGASEYVSTHMYNVIFGSLSISGMILTRTLSFYIPLLVIMFIIGIVTKIKYMKD